MEKVKMWNWYGESFDRKVNDSKLNYSSFLNQAKNVFDRQKRELDLKKKINKELFIKAKRNLEFEQEKALETLKISSKNKIQVLEETYKQLKISDKLTSFIAFEIKKIDKQNAESANYVKNYYAMLLKTADEVEVKEKNMTSIINKAKADENKLLKHKAKLVILHKYLLFTKKEDLIYSELEEFIQKRTGMFSELEIKSILEEKEKIENLFKTLKNKREKFQTKKAEITKEFPIIKEESKKEYKQEVSRIKKEYKERILEAEFSYNKEYDEQLALIKAEFKTKKEKIESKKQEIVTLSKEKEAKYSQYVKTKEEQAKILKQEYKQELKLAKMLFKINKEYNNALLISKFLKLEEEKHLKSIYSLYKKELVNKFLNKQDYRQDIENKIQNHFNSLVQEINNKTKDLNKEENSKLKIILNTNLPLILKNQKNRNVKNLVKANYYKKLGKLQQEYSYDGDFLLKKSEALYEYAKDSNKQLNSSANEIKDAKLKLHKINLNETAEDKVKYKNQILSLTKEYKEKIAILKQRYKNKDLTKKAFAFKLKEEKILYKEKLVTLKLHNEKEKNKVIVKTQYSRLSSQLKITKKIYESKVVEAIKQVPTENKKGAKYKGLFLNLLFPGLAQLILFKEYKKGILLTLLSAFLYLIFVPFSLGITWNKIGGIQGIVDLGKSVHNIDLGILPDARFWMFGAAASFILLGITIAYVVSSGIGAYRRGKFLEEGMRPQNWTQTKKWLSEQGFPWLISIPGWFLIAFIVVVPLITSLFISLSNTGFQHTPPSQTVDWVGFTQYGKWWLFRNNGLLTSLSRVISWTLIWTFAAAFSVIVVGTLFAVLVNMEKIKGKKFFRLIYIIPWAIPAFVTIIFLKSAFQGDANSYINYILIKLGLIENSINFFGSVHWVRFLLIVIQTWLGHSYIFLLITGNLQSIPKDIYEAGEIDGAKRSKLFRHITLPILVSSLAPLLIGQFTFMFNNFTIISLFSNGGPAYADQTTFSESGSDIIISWIYKLTTTVQIDGNVAFSSALVILASVFSVSIAAYGFAKNAAKGGR
ncbi:ABC transporter permease subunit [Mycoplasma sp. 1012]